MDRIELSALLVVIALGSAGCSHSGGSGGFEGSTAGASTNTTPSTLGSGVVSTTPIAPITTQTSAASTAVPPARFLYVANHTGSTISEFAIDPTSGALSFAGAPVSTGEGTGPWALAADPKGAFLFSANRTSGDVSSFSIDATTGELSLVVGSKKNGNTPAGTAPSCIAVSPDGTRLVVCNEASVESYQIDRVNGALTVASKLAVGEYMQPEALAFEPAGEFVYVCGGAGILQISIDSAGNLLLAGKPVKTGPGASGIAIDASGAFAFVTSSTDKTIRAFTIDPTSAELKATGTPVAAGGVPSSIVLGPSGQFAYVVLANKKSLASFSVGAQGALTPVSTPEATGTTPESVNVDPSGTFAFTADEGDDTIAVFTIGAASGLASTTGNPVSFPAGLAGPHSAVAVE
jgi:6-phosphogluconolactonase (cycloisomerase 2 family)